MKCISTKFSLNIAYALKFFGYANEIEKDKPKKFVQLET